MESQFLRRRNPDPNAKESRDWKGAIEDAIVVFLLVFFSNLAGYGYPPTIQALYTSIISAILAFLISIQRKFKIEIPEEVKA